MIMLADLLRDVSLRGLHTLAGDPSSSAVSSVKLVESLDGLAALPDGALAILTANASRLSGGYKLDINLRQAASQGVAGWMLTGPAAPTRVSATASALAQRSGITIISAPDRDLVDLVFAASTAIAGSADDALHRAGEALDKLQRTEAASVSGETEGLLAVASEALGALVSVRVAKPGEIAAGVSLDGQELATIVAPQLTGNAKIAARLIVSATAAAMERSLSAGAHGYGIPIRTRSAVLGDILMTDGVNSVRLSDQARNLGISIDGWHRALMLQVVSPSAPLSFDLQQAVGEAALRSIRLGQGRWHLARIEDRLALIEMWGRRPLQAARQLGMTTANDVLESIGIQFPQLKIRCGVGTPHQGLHGLRATVAEARAALAFSNRAALVGYDVAGLQPMLIEWYGTDTARQAVRELLAPLDELGGARAQTAIRTLQAYLDEQGSVVRTAERLHLHRNAIAYRMRQIRMLLEVDLDDPDQRLALQLACRARLLH